MLRIWLKAIARAHDPRVQHIVFFVGDHIPPDLHQKGVRFVAVERSLGTLRPSIGTFHNMGAELANTEWIMKLDVDALPNEGFFHHLCTVLRKAPARAWFNVGMFTINKQASETYLNEASDPVSVETYEEVTKRIMTTTGMSYHLPVATNFVCRKKDYQLLGGCDPRFRGWGWEDYQQIYMLEQHERGADPLPGPITLDNVTIRCRDGISRPKARELWERCNLLALLHHWHAPSSDNSYKNPRNVNGNRLVLMDYIMQARKQEMVTAV